MFVQRKHKRSFVREAWHPELYHDSFLQQFDYSDLHFVVREFDSIIIIIKEKKKK
jgi:hypothetical protein